MQNRAVHLLENAGKVLESLTEPSVTALASTSHVETRVHAPRRTPRRTTPRNSRAGGNPGVPTAC
jgi:hypothetical protein